MTCVKGAMVAEATGRRPPESKRTGRPGRAVAGPVEVGTVVAVVLAVWRLALGWDWSLVPGGRPGIDAAPQTGLGWLVLALVAIACVGWLAMRGRPVVGCFAVCVPVVLASGWRLAAGRVIGWPTELAALVFALSLTCMTTATISAWLRRRVEVHRES
jgi:hypothetical protein